MSVLPSDHFYVPGTSLEVPGLEAILEYGDASKIARDRIPGAMLINDHSRLERARITQLDGLHDDPEGAESRQGNSDRHGERAGNLRYRGRTIGLTGRVEAGNIGAMRNVWRRFRGQFGLNERDLLIHHPLEIRAYVNETINSNLDVDAFGWKISNTGGGTPTVTGGVTDGSGKVGEASVASATGAGAIRAYNGLDDDSTGLSTGLTPWSGEDVWITALVSPRTSLGSPVSSVGIGLGQWKNIAPFGATVGFTVFSSISNPTTASWNLLSVRIPGSSIDADTEYISLIASLSFSAAGTHGVRISRAACVFLDPDDPTPVAYFGAELPGFSCKGVSGRSQSFGPTHAESLIFDPRFESIDEANSGANLGIRFLRAWQGAVTGTGATINQVPILSTRWQGDSVPNSLYFKATSGSSGTSTITLSPLTFPSITDFSTSTALHQAVANRRYRLSFKVNLISKPSNGNLVAQISWRNQAGNEISASTSVPLVVGENYASVEATAPAGTVFAIASLSQSTTTTGAALELFLSDPCWIDVTDWDPGNFSGGGDIAEEVGGVRRIPRPFLVRRVRKTSDMKAPEQQTRSRAWRDFTMSLRASDPRIYCLDERSKSIVLPATSQLQHFSIGGGDFATGVTPPPVPPNSTYEGHSLPTNSEWTIYVNPFLGTLNPQHVNSGRGFKLWSGSAFLARPANAALARFYRNTFTYTKPRIILGCSPAGMSSLTGGLAAMEYPGFVTGTSTNANLAATNSVSAIKRINSTTWLELRWNALSYYYALNSNPSLTNAPHAFELWCSHNSSGALSTTRLAFWDYDGESPTNWPLQFDPTAQPRYLRFELFGTNPFGNNAAYWALYDSHPGVLGYAEDNLVQSGAFVLPSPVNALVGPSVAGHAAAAIKVDNPTGNTTVSGVSKPAWERLAGNGPFIHHFEAVKGEWPGRAAQVSVIGDADDTPPIFEISGRITDPAIYFTNLDDRTSGAVFLSGTVAAYETLTIDLTDGGSIRSSNGANRYDMLRPGSRLPMLKSGRTVIALAANDWDDTLPEHLRIRWRDALV